MSDTLQERESETTTTVDYCDKCKGRPHAPWCSLYGESKEYQRDMFPVGARVRAIAPINRSELGDDIPVGAWGTVSSHCDDGRAYVFFDGYDEGHTFHQPELSIRATCTHQNNDNRCPANQVATIPHQPAARGGGDEWEYVETRYGAEAKAGNFIIRLHWTGLADIGDTRGTIQQIVTEHNQHQSLVAERESLRESLRQAREFICEATWGKGARARDAERMVLQIDVSLNPITDSDQKGPSE